MATEIDFDDEDAVLDEMAHELDIDPDDLKIRESRGLTGFGAGTVYEVSIRGGHKEWCVVADEDQEQELAIEIVKQDLDESPENFTQSWLEGHIDTDRLRRDLESPGSSSGMTYVWAKRKVGAETKEARRHPARAKRRS